MRALVLKGYGGPKTTELREVPEPTVGPHELLVRVHAAGLNPTDYKTRRGQLRLLFHYPLPAIMGKEFAGTVVRCGPGVVNFTEGERVFGRVAQNRMGAFAEYVAVDEKYVARMPSTLEFTPAAGVPLAGLTALQCLRDELVVKPGKRVFISGSAGGVGTFAIQIAKWLGAEVATTASSRGAALVRSLGADLVIDYNREHFESELRNFDGAFDLVGGTTLLRSFAIVKPGHKVVSIAGMPDPLTALKDLGLRLDLAVLFLFGSLPIHILALSHGVFYRYVFMHPSGADLSELAVLVDSGQLKVVVDRVFRFDEIGEAFAYLESGHAKGKVIVRLVES